LLSWSSARDHLLLYREGSIICFAEGCGKVNLGRKYPVTSFELRWWLPIVVLCRKKSTDELERGLRWSIRYPISSFKWNQRSHRPRNHWGVISVEWLVIRCLEDRVTFRLRCFQYNPVTMSEP